MQSTDEFVITNIRLPKRDLKALKHEALMRERSVNALLREMIDRYFQTEGRPASTEKTHRSVWDLPGYAEHTGDPHLAECVDAIVYGT